MAEKKPKKIDKFKSRVKSIFSGKKKPPSISAPTATSSQSEAPVEMGTGSPPATTHGEPVSAEPSKPKVDTGLFTGVPRAAPSPLIKAPEEGGMTATSGPLEAFNPPQAKDKGTAEGKGKDKATTEPEPETPKSIKRKSGFDQLYDPDASQLDIPTQSEKWI